MEDGLLCEDIEMLNGVIQDDARHCNSSQGVGHVNACIGEITGLVHICSV